MKQFFALSAVIALTFLSSCSSFQQIGKVNMISNRNVESKTEYVLIKNYAGGSNKELKRSRAKSINDAIDQTVKSTPGGEFLKNVKIYSIDGKYFAVEGDVWGFSQNISYMGFQNGDKVQWTAMFKTYTGVITNLTNDKICQVKGDLDGKVVEVEYDKLMKLN